MKTNFVHSFSFQKLVQKIFIVERPDPKDLSTFSQYTKFLAKRGFELTSSRSGGRCSNYSKRMLVWVSAGFSTELPPVPIWYCTWGLFNREVLSAMASAKWWVCQHCKDKIPKFRNKYSQKRNIGGSQSQFPCTYTCLCVIYTIGLPILLEEICRPILGLYKSLTDTWMWKLGLRPHYSQKRNT